MADFKCVISEETTQSFKDNVKVSVIMPILSSDDINCLQERIKKIEESCEYVENLTWNIIVPTEIDFDISEVSSYSIKKIHKKTTGIADTLNIGIDYCYGQYFIISMFDSNIKLTRVKNQLTLLQLNQCDVLFNNSNTIGKLVELFATNLYLHSLAGVTIKVKSLPIKFEQYYDGNPKKFALNCQNNNLVVYTHVIDVSDSFTEKFNNEKIIRLLDYKNDGELTCIICFKNEDIEVEKTIQSIRSVSHNVRILLLNDCSTDKYNYKKVADKYNCKYIESSTPLGTGGARHFAVENCETEYFIQFDAHMRFYDLDWDITVLDFLKNHPNDMLCLNTGIIHKDNQGYYENEDNTGGKPDSIGARLCFEEGKEFDLKWLNKNKIKEDYSKHIREIPCILGASYATSKTHWKDINGLEGMKYYGFDEINMSLRTWLLGGKSYEIYSIFIGHLYRSKPTYSSPLSEYESNRLRCIDLFTKGELNTTLKNRLKERLGEKLWNETLSKYDNQQEILDIKFLQGFKQTRKIEEYIEWNKTLK